MRSRVMKCEPICRGAGRGGVKQKQAGGKGVC